MIYVGKPCKEGHVLRYKNGNCIKCHIEWKKTHSWAKKSQQASKHYIENRIKILAAVHKYREENINRIRKYDRERYTKNPEPNKTRTKHRYSNKKQLINKYNSEWKKNNPDKVNAMATFRKANKLKATPNWLTEEHLNQILLKYTEAKRLTSETGIKYVVDHQIPLQGRKVCGLHVPWNLQVITAVDNLRKFISYESG